MSITRADAVRLILTGCHVQGGNERIAVAVAQKRDLGAHLRVEFGIGGFSCFALDDGGEASIDCRAKGLRIEERGAETVHLPWNTCAYLVLSERPDRPCTTAECGDCESWGPSARGRVKCRITNVSHTWGQPCSRKETPLTLFDLPDECDEEDE